MGARCERGGRARVPAQGSTRQVHSVSRCDWRTEGLLVLVGGNYYYKVQLSPMKLCASRGFWLVAKNSNETLSKKSTPG